MKILFHLGHPAHFHLFKNVIKQLESNGDQCLILIKEKDVLRHLLEGSGFKYENILPEGKSNGWLGLFSDLVKRGSRIIKYCRIHKPDLLIGTSPDISYVGKFLGIPAVNVQEDDADAVPLHAWIAYPWATDIISPDCCNNSRWNNKTTFYAGYHELSYLHPENFLPKKEIVSKYLNPNDPYFVLRFVSLNAHHDDGVNGLSDEMAEQLIEMLEGKGKIIITSERKLKPSVEKYRLNVDPQDIHHVLAFSKLVIGDSQTMSAESGVLGVPFIRFNDFVGKLGYLEELENKYKLGFGFTTDKAKEMIQKVVELVESDVSKEFLIRRDQLLKEKINVADFLYTYITTKKYLKNKYAD